MARGFTGYPKQGLTWLRQIPKHNERAWFRAQKAVFDGDVRAPTEALVAALNGRLRRLAPEYVTEPRRAIGRIYRDTRFSDDKTPYKTFLLTSFRRTGCAPGTSAGLWVRLSAQGVGVLGGTYAPGAPHVRPRALQMLRQHVAAHHRELDRLLARKAVRETFGDPQGAQLQRIPSGFERNHVAGTWLRYRQLYLGSRLPLSLAATPALVREIARHFRLLVPLVRFLDAGLVPEACAPPRTNAGG